MKYVQSKLLLCLNTLASLSPTLSPLLAPFQSLKCCWLTLDKEFITYSIYFTRVHGYSMNFACACVLYLYKKVAVAVVDVEILEQPSE